MTTTGSSWPRGPERQSTSPVKRTGECPSTLSSIMIVTSSIGREAMLEALEKAKGRFVPPYPTLKPK